MKKIIIILVLLLLPMSMFAQFYIGASAMLKGDPLNPPTIVWYDTNSLLDNFAFGVDARVNLSIFEIQALALYNLNQSFNAYLDVGIVLNIAIVSIGAGVGPNFVVVFNTAAPAVDTFGFGFNGKVHADINLGSFKISVYYMFLMDNLSVADLTSNMYAGNAGLSLMFKL